MSITNSPQENNPKPSKWALQQQWRHIYDFDTFDAEEARKALVHLNFYPLGRTTGDSAFDAQEVNKRFALHQIVDELQREDLNAVFLLARLLVLFPDGLQAALDLVETKHKRHVQWYKGQKKVTKIDDPDILKILSMTEGEDIESPDYLKLIDEIPGEDLEEPNYLDLLDEE